MNTQLQEIIEQNNRLIALNEKVVFLLGFISDTLKTDIMPQLSLMDSSSEVGSISTSIDSIEVMLNKLQRSNSGS